MSNVYGYIQNYNGAFIEVGLTEKGSKIAATKREIQVNGYDSVTVGYRSPINNMFIATCCRVDGVWKDISECID